MPWLNAAISNFLSFLVLILTPIQFSMFKLIK